MVPTRVKCLKLIAFKAEPSPDIRPKSTTLIGTLDIKRIFTAFPWHINGFHMKNIRFTWIDARMFFVLNIISDSALLGMLSKSFFSIILGNLKTWTWTWTMIYPCNVRTTKKKNCWELGFRGKTPFFGWENFFICGFVELANTMNLIFICDAVRD